ncbi:peptidase M16 domain protein, partial [mine drainage metagenome]
MLADVVLRPRFGSADLARVRRQLLERQLRDVTQPDHRVEREMLAALFPAGHPYRSTGVGDRASVARADPTSVRRFRRDHFGGPGSVLIVTAPVPMETLRRVAGRLFAELPPTGPSRPVVPAPRPPRRREVRVDLPGTAQVDVRLARVSIERSDPLYPAAYLANEVLGGSSLLSRLYARVRGHGGLAYHASSQLEAMRWGGYWDARVGTGPDRWRRVVPMLREEADRMVHRPAPEAEISIIRESRIGAVQLALETTAEAHELAVDVAYHELPVDYYRRWPDVLRALAPRDVRRAAEVAIDPADGVTVVVGP